MSAGLIFFSPLEHSAYFLEGFFMRCDVLISHADSGPEVTRVDQGVGKNIVLSKDPNLEPPSGAAGYIRVPGPVAGV